MSGWSWASNRKIRNGPYMAGCSPEVNGSTCTVMFGWPAALMSLSIWARMTSGPVVAAGRRSVFSSSTSPSLGGSGGGEAGLDAGAGVLRGLQQSGDPVRIVTADQGGGFFQADEGAEPGRQHVVVAVPPAGFGRVAGQGEEGVDLAGGGDAVGHQQALDGQRLKAAFGAFHPADGVGGGVDRLSGLLVVQAGLFAQRLELPAQDHPQHGGAAARPGFGHACLPPFSCAKRAMAVTVPQCQVSHLSLTGPVWDPVITPFCNVHGSR